MDQAINLEPVAQSENSEESRLFSEDEMARVIEEAKTFADFFRWIDERLHRFQSKRFEGAIADLPRETQAQVRAIGEQVDKEWRRRLEPWPDWVLRVATEIWAVRNPTIPKAKIYDGFRFIHFVFFEMQLRDAKQILHDVNFDPKIFGALLGHSVGGIEHMRSQLDQYLAAGVLSKERHEKYAKEFSTEHYMTKMAAPLAECAKKHPDRILEFTESMVNAKAKTLDKNGQPKETGLTPIYEVIFENWIDVEKMSGPTELWKFLTPNLKGGIDDLENKLDRVKKICQRMGIFFKGRVKGQKHTPPPSLPEPK